MPRSKLFTTLFVALPWMITSAKLEWGGDSPDQQQVGAVKDTRLRVMIQWRVSCWPAVITGGVCAILAFRMAPQAHRVSNLPRRSIVPGRPRHPTR